MNNHESLFAYLIDLKRQETQLKDQIKLAQEKAIEVAMEMGKTGKIATIDGASVTFELVTVKPNTPMMRLIQEDINDIKAELEAKNASEIEDLQRRLIDLTTNEDIQELEVKLIEETPKHEGEKKPQIAITLPKTMNKQYLVIDFEQCFYSVKTLSDDEVSTTDAAVIRWNGKGFEEQLASRTRILDENENPVDVKLLWVKVSSTPEQCVELVKSFLSEKEANQ